MSTVSIRYELQGILYILSISMIDNNNLYTNII